MLVGKHEDRQRISRKMDDEFYNKKAQVEPPGGDIGRILAALQSSPDIMSELMKRVSAGEN